MTDFEEKFNEFREEFRKAALNGGIEYSVEQPLSLSYHGTIVFSTCFGDIKIAVADTYLCCHNNIFDDLFSKDDINKLNVMVGKQLRKSDIDSKKRLISSLREQIRILEKEIAS